MPKYKNKTYPLRIDNELRQKIEYIAKTEVRKINQQYELIISKFIEQYEKTNGKLIVEEDGTVHKEISKHQEKSSTFKTG